MMSRTAAVACSALLAGCSAASAPPYACSTQACLTDYYFNALLPESPDAACAPVTPADRLDRMLSLSLFWGGGASDDTVAFQGSHLQRYFWPYELEFGVAQPAADSSLDYAMTGNAAELDAALLQAGIPINGALTPDQQHLANRAVGPIIFANLRAFVQSHSRAQTVNVVVLEHVVSPELDTYLFGSPGAAVIGFAISPNLFAQVSALDPEYDLWEMTGLSSDFTPVLFIGNADIGALRGSADNIIAHEMGHALGLPHTNQPGNLMTPGQNRPCDEALSPWQLAEVRQDLAGGAPDAAALVAAAQVDWIPLSVMSVVRAWQARQSGQIANSIRPTY